MREGIAAEKIKERLRKGDKTDMKRTKLRETRIKDLETFQWVEYFKFNNAHLFKLDFSNDHELSAREKKLITPSIRAFQIGEGSKGEHLKKAVRKFAKKTGYREYPEIMKWFIMEENRHSKTLKKYMEIYQIENCKALWIDNVFRLLRKMMGIECEVIILVTAEMIALSYYTALSNATNSALLKKICRQMLNDELKHVVLQSDTLFRISKNRNEAANVLIRGIRRLIMRMTSLTVWLMYQDLLKKGHYTYKLFTRHCMEYLEESIYIEKYGKIKGL